MARRTKAGVTHGNPANGELDDLVERQIARGRFTSAEEVVGEALRLFETTEQARAQELAGFNNGLQTRLDSLERGEYVEPDELWSELEQMSAERRRMVA